MQIRHSVDLTALEAHVLETVASRPNGGLQEALLVLVPTRRLADHLKRRIAEALGATLEVHILTHRGLALRALEYALVPPPRVLPPPVPLALVEALVASECPEESDSLCRHAGARRHLLSAFRELREAGIDGSMVAGERTAGPVGRLYPRFEAALGELGALGLTDEAGLIRLATPLVPGFLRGKGIRRVLHHGAYELVGVHIDLLVACTSVVAVEVLLPGEIRGAAFSVVRRTVDALRRTLQRQRARLPSPAQVQVAHLPSSEPRRRWIERLHALYEPEVTWEDAVVEPALEIWHAQGAEAELRLAVLRALALHERSGVPLDEIAIVARSLQPYSPLLTAVFAELKLPFTTSATLSLHRVPGLRDVLCLLRVLSRDFERQPVMDLLRSEWLRCPGLAPEPADVNRWDRWSRHGRIVQGLDAWRELPAILDRLETESDPLADPEPGSSGRSDRMESLARLMAALDVLDTARSAWRSLTDLDDHESWLLDLVTRFFPVAAQAPPAENLREHLRSAFDGLRLMRHARESLGPARAGPVDPCALEADLRVLVDSRKVPCPGAGERGIRVLDLMQARGLVHRAVIWIGFHHGLFPRLPGGATGLRDSTRQRLVELAERPLYPEMDGGMEERLLLAMTLGSVRERLVLVFQRADEDGRKQARSSALREIARVFSGEPDACRLVLESGGNPFAPRRVPAHPAGRARALLVAPSLGLAPPRDALVACVVRARNGALAARRFLGEFATVDSATDRALACVERLESFDASEPLHDGMTGVGLTADWRFSPSSLERLGRCPLQFFLRDVLGVGELDQEAVAHRVESNVLGEAVHGALARLYGGLVDDGVFPVSTGSLEDVTSTALDRLEDLWRHELEAIAGPSLRRLRGLYDILASGWLGSLRDFVRHDLARLAELRARPIALEQWLREDLRVTTGAVLPLGGRLDRVLGCEAGEAFVQVDDFKTGRSLVQKLRPAEQLRGHEIQLPLYRELVEASALGQGLAVRASLLPVGPEAEVGEQRLTDRAGVRSGTLETIGVLLDLARRGRFPAHASRWCSYCGYRATCRRDHEPTRHRFQIGPELADFRDCKLKSSRRGLSTLAGVRASLDQTDPATEEEGGDTG